MTPEEFATAAGEAKREYDQETQNLENQLARAREKVSRTETKLAAINESYRARISQLSASFLGLPLADTSSQDHEASIRKAPHERKRGAFDQPILDLSRSLIIAAGTPDITSRRLAEEWNRRDPQSPLTESTVRSILDRLVTKGLLVITFEGGGQGSGIPKRYRPVESE